MYTYRQKTTNVCLNTHVHVLKSSYISSLLIHAKRTVLKLIIYITYYITNTLALGISGMDKVGVVVLVVSFGMKLSTGVASVVFQHLRGLEVLPVGVSELVNEVQHLSSPKGVQVSERSWGLRR